MKFSFLHLAVALGITILLLRTCRAHGDVPPPHTSLPQKELVGTIQKNHKGGTWYMADDGHAVYCYGPQRMLPDSNGGFMRIATFCRGGRAIVRLKE